MNLTDPITPPAEPCTESAVPAGGAPPGFIQPPPDLVDPSTNAEGRLVAWLRSAAQLRDTMTMLTESAVDYYLAAHPAAWIMRPSTAQAQALADLAVTGRATFEQFRTLLPSEATLVPRVQAQLAAFGLTPSGMDVTTAAASALNRAYTVAAALRGGVSLRASTRPGLGWVAVSGEDDAPHRPVNVPCMAYAQYDIPVTLPARTAARTPVTVQTRFYVASTRPAPEPAAPRPRALPTEPAPIVPARDRVILFIHGHSSSADEASTIIPALLGAGLAVGKHYSIISFDMPSNGYSTMIAHDTVADEPTFHIPEPPESGPITTPLLDFVEDFIVAFVGALDALNPAAPITSRFAGIIGGSLGGNMGLRLGRRDLHQFPWIGSGIVSWDPGSVWGPMVDPIKGAAVLSSRGSWQDTSETPDQDDPKRSSYFHAVFDTTTVPLILPTQPQMWYRDDWVPCKGVHILESRLARREIYNPIFRAWHWRAAGEQLLFSHVDRVVHDDTTTPFRYTLNTARQLLAAGASDNYPFSNIYDATRSLAPLMTNTPGQTLFLLDTGHSIHAERPVFFASQIAAFLT
jgi:pimeloyl-ACP methyl ester carboxylesterase